MSKIDALSGYDFEILISNLLNNMGFSVEHTLLSRDGGVDIIAKSKEAISGGIYLVQCKRFSGTVGEPYIRDLYGVVLSKRANRGILITNSKFSKEAKSFADGKNIGLIDGDALNQLLIKYELYSSVDENAKIEGTSFIDINGFDKDRYDYLSEIAYGDKLNFTAAKNLFDFLYGYILNSNTNSLNTSLIEKCLEVLSNMESVFQKGPKKRSKTAYRQWKECFSGISSFLLICDGQIEEAVKKIKYSGWFAYSQQRMNGFFPPFPLHYEVVDHEGPDNSLNRMARVYSEKVTYSYNSIIILYNFLVVFVNLDFKLGIDCILSNFEERCQNYRVYPPVGTAILDERIIPIDKKNIDLNIDLYKRKVSEVIDKSDARIFTPKLMFDSFGSPEDDSHFFYQFDDERYLKFTDIIKQWTTDTDISRIRQNLSYLFPIETI